MTLRQAKAILAVANGPGRIPYTDEAERKEFFRLCAIAAPIVREAERREIAAMKFVPADPARILRGKPFRPA